MTRHYQKLKQYVADVSKDYGMGERFLQALQSDLTLLGKELGLDLASQGVSLLQAGATQVAGAGLARLADWLGTKPRK